MQPILQDLLNILDIERLEANWFRGQSRDLGGKSVFGGQVIGQGLVAATRTVQAEAKMHNRLPHSLHAYFLRPGDMETPIVYEVENLRDGTSFSVRRVQAIQFGKPILSMIASFQKPDDGFVHQREMSDVIPPEKLESQAVLRQQWLNDYQQNAIQSGMESLSEKLQKAILRSLAIEFRPVQPWNALAPTAEKPIQQIWFRAAGKLPKQADLIYDQLLHRCVLAYASDFNLLGTALFPHERSWFSRDMQIASLDHAVWFHADIQADEWLLYDMESPRASEGRGLSRGLIYNRAGVLVASVAQESLMRQV